MVSSGAGFWQGACASEFQSRNRGTFGFKFEEALQQFQKDLFQSRNRGTFGFKGTLLEVLLYVL